MPVALPLPASASIQDVFRASCPWRHSALHLLFTRLREKGREGQLPSAARSPRGDGTQCLKGLASCFVKSDHCPHGGSSSLAAQDLLPGTGKAPGDGAGAQACCCMRLNLHCTFLFLCFLFLRSPGSSQGSEVSLGVTGSLVVHDGEGYATGMSLVGREYVCLCLVDGPAARFLEMA